MADCTIVINANSAIACGALDLVCFWDQHPAFAGMLSAAALQIGGIGSDAQRARGSNQETDRLFFHIQTLTNHFGLTVPDNALRRLSEPAWSATRRRLAV